MEKKAIEREIGRRQQNCYSRQKLREKAAAEITSDAAGEVHHRRTGNGRPQAQREERISGRMPNDPGNQRDQGRLVHIAPGEMFAASHVIQFVAKKSIMVDSRKLDQQFDES